MYIFLPQNTFKFIVCDHYYKLNIIIMESINFDEFAKLEESQIFNEKKKLNQIIASFEQKQKWQKIMRNIQDDGLNPEIEIYEMELKDLKQKKSQF